MNFLDRLKQSFVERVVVWYGKPIVANCHIYGTIKADMPGGIIYNNLFVPVDCIFDVDGVKIGDALADAIAKDMAKRIATGAR